MSLFSSAGSPLFFELRGPDGAVFFACATPTQQAAWTRWDIAVQWVGPGAPSEKEQQDAMEQISLMIQAHPYAAALRHAGAEAARN